MATKIDMDEVLKAAEQAAAASEQLLAKGCGKKAYDQFSKDTGADEDEKAVDEDEDEDEKDEDKDEKPGVGATALKKIYGPSDTRAKSSPKLTRARKALDLAKEAYEAARKSFDAAKEQPLDDEKAELASGDYDDHVAEELPFDEDEEEDEESGEGKKVPRAHANAENTASGRKSLKDSKAIQQRIDVSDFLKALVDGVDAGLNDVSQLQVNTVKSLAALVQSNVALGNELRKQNVALKAVHARLERIEKTPFPRATRAVPLAKAVERFPEIAGPQQGMTKSEVANKLVALAEKGDARVSAATVSQFLVTGQLTADLRAAVGMTE